MVSTCLYLLCRMISFKFPSFLKVVQYCIQSGKFYFFNAVMSPTTDVGWILMTSWLSCYGRMISLTYERIIIARNVYVAAAHT